MADSVGTSRVPMMALMAAYAAVLFGTISFLRHHASLPIVEKSIIALLPMIPALFTVPLILKRFRALDEMQARHRLEAGAVATMICGFLALTYGFLERTGFPRQSMFIVWGVLGFSWIIANGIQRWRFR